MIMANVSDMINMSEIKEAIIGSLTSSISPLVTIFEIVGVAILVYVLFLIVKALFRWRTMSKISRISKNVRQINQKLDILIKRAKPIQEKEKVEKKKKGKK